MAAKLTLAQFIERLPAIVPAFAQATREAGETDDSFNQSRTLSDWCAELTAWATLDEVDAAIDAILPSRRLARDGRM